VSNVVALTNPGPDLAKKLRQIADRIDAGELAPRNGLVVLLTREGDNEWTKVVPLVSPAWTSELLGMISLAQGHIFGDTLTEE